MFRYSLYFNTPSLSTPNGLLKLLLHHFVSIHVKLSIYRSLNIDIDLLDIFVVNLTMNLVVDLGERDIGKYIEKYVTTKSI